MDNDNYLLKLDDGGAASLERDTLWVWSWCGRRVVVGEEVSENRLDDGKFMIVMVLGYGYR